MRKKILGGIAVLVVAIVAAVNVNLNSQKSDLSDISLANVEALAQETCNYTAGYSMGDKIVLEGFNIGFGYPLGVSFTGRFKTIKCCLSSVIANACNFSAQDKDC